MILFAFSVLVLSFVLVTLSLVGHEAAAQEMRSQNFIINGGNFNMTSGNKSSTNFKLSDVVGQTIAGQFGSKGYYIRAGFLNSAAGAIFSFSVTPNVVDFGNLIPNNPLQKTLQISIANGNATGYSVRAAENQPLTTTAGAEIVDTVCDGGKGGACTATAAAPWMNNTSYGFGYRVNGPTSPSDFAKDGFFRPFPSTRRNEQPILVMQSKAKNVKDTAVMTLRLAVGLNQPVGQYRNVISFTALAGI